MNVSPTACTSGRTQTETDPVGRLEPPVGVISIPIPCSLDCNCDGEMPPKEAETHSSLSRVAGEKGSAE